MYKDGQRCMDLIKLTANSLSGGIVALMLVAVQKDNLEVSINRAIKQWVLIFNKMRITGYTHNTGRKITLKKDKGTQEQ